jgi:hypothetical protein
MGASRRFRLSSCLVILVVACACVPRTPPPAAPRPAPPLQAAAPPAPPAAPPATPVAWQDGSLTAGDWSYSRAGPQASFGGPGLMLFALRCDAGRQIIMLRFGASRGPITIVTSFAERVVPGSGDQERALSALPASDSLFDQIAFSRGRFLVRTAGAGDLVLPSWPEAARLIEDCRGQ